MHTRIGKWGNSLAVRIPGTYAKDLDLKEGTAFDVSLVEGGIHLRPRPKRYSLDELVSRITPQNTHEETNWGRALGGGSRDHLKSADWRARSAKYAGLAPVEVLAEVRAKLKPLLGT